MTWDIRGLALCSVVFLATLGVTAVVAEWALNRGW